VEPVQDIRLTIKDYKLYFKKLDAEEKLFCNYTGGWQIIPYGKPKFLLELDKRASFLENIIRQYDKFGCLFMVVVRRLTDNIYNAIIKG
jgi:hypothetical protein